MKKTQTLAERLVLLREEYEITPERLGAILNKSRVAVDNIEKGITLKPQESTINLIAEKLGTTKEWLMNGLGEMLPNGKLNINSGNSSSDTNPWKDEAWREIKSKNEILERNLNNMEAEIKRVWQIVQHLTNTNSGDKGEKLNFLKSFGKEAVNKSRYQKSATMRN